MGVEGFFGYLNREKVEGAFKEHTINEFLEQIRLYRAKNRRSPKILFNLYAFNNYYEQTIHDVIFGCRFNVIKKDFEILLSKLKNAGAELLFVSKKNRFDYQQDVRFDSLNESYEKGLMFMDIIRRGNSAKELGNRLSRQRIFPWQETTIHVLVQSAKKFGTFKESNFFQNTTVSHLQLADDEDVFAICGLNTSYLFHKASWKILFPTKNFHVQTRTKELILKEFDRQKILDHFGFTDDQFQLFAVLGGKLATSLEYTQILKDHFKNGKWTDFRLIQKFVQRYAPANKFPLNREATDTILFEIFGHGDDQLREELEQAVAGEHKINASKSLDIDEKTKILLQRDSFSSIAECIFYDIPFEILSPFLDALATDMLSLKDLTLEWIERFGGILLKDIDETRLISIIYRMPSGKLEKYEATPQFPFGLPEWSQLIADEISSDEKYQTLEYLIGGIISIDELKTIPREYLMHVILTKHLVKNNSMTMEEATAMTKAVCDASNERFLVYPERVSVRAFRVSALYEKMFSVLLMCLSPLGLNDFIAELTLDNVLFQKNLAERSNSPVNANFETIMAIIR